MLTEVDATTMLPDEAEGRDLFPYDYALGFLRFLRRNRHSVRVITYADLDFSDDEDYEKNYLAEFERWNARARMTRWMRETIFVLLQHDVDSLPSHAMRMIEDEHRLGLKATVMIFRCRVHRRLLATQGKVSETDYALDTDLLLKLERNEFVIGYHSNAYEQAGFDSDRAAAIFEDDVATLRQRFNVRFFSPHGGVRDASGRSNNVIDPPASVRATLRWVHNNHTVRFHGSYSDGGINNAKRKLQTLDLMAFVKTWKPGKRYRVLLHPQYYGDPVVPSPRLVGFDWYNRVLVTYGAQRHLFPCMRPDLWRGAELRLPKPSLYKRIRNVLYQR